MFGRLLLSKIGNDLVAVSQLVATFTKLDGEYTTKGHYKSRVVDTGLF